MRVCPVGRYLVKSGAEIVLKFYFINTIALFILEFFFLQSQCSIRKCR